MFLRQYKLFLAYLNKDNFDHTQGLIDPLTFHTSFISLARVFGVMDYEVLPLWMYICPTLTGVSAITAGTIFFISMIEYIRTFRVHFLTESGTYLLVMIYKFLILCSIMNGRKNYHKLLQAVRDDFNYVCTMGQKYREKFFENQRLTFRGSILVSMFVGSIGTGMVICACIAVAIAFNSQGPDAERPLPFPFWLFGYNVHKSPVYEILFIASALFTFFHTFLYIFMIQTQVLWVREITCKADIIIWNLQDLLVDVSPAKNTEQKEYFAQVIKHRMRTIIEMHHAMFDLAKDYAAVFKKCLLYEQLIASPIICMTAYCFAEKYDAGEVKVILLLLCTAVIVVVFIPCYLCTHMLEKVQSVSDACWDTPFWNAGPVVGPYLILIMQRSLRPLPVAAAGFADISLETFSNMMTRAYSCFNMLRQADFNIS